ncbi:hypothetical protein GCM10009000_089290 [Halobacterium noricense]
MRTANEVSRERSECEFVGACSDVSEAAVRSWWVGLKGADSLVSRDEASTEARGSGATECEARSESQATRLSGAFAVVTKMSFWVVTTVLLSPTIPDTRPPPPTTDLTNSRNT